MKNRNYPVFLLLSVLLINNPCSSQTHIIINPAVKTKYELAVKMVPKKYNVVLNKSGAGWDKRTKEYNERVGIGMFTIYETDTLNRNELITRMGKVVITDVDDRVVNTKKIESKPNGDLYYVEEKTGNPVRVKPSADSRNTESNTYIPLFISSILQSDSLHINLPWIFEPAIESILTPHSVVAVYKEYLKYDSVFRINLNEAKQSLIRVPINIVSFTISDTSFRKDINMYGEAEMRTLPYYVDDMNFTSGYLKKQMHLKFVFKLKPGSKSFSFSEK